MTSLREEPVRFIGSEENDLVGTLFSAVQNTDHPPALFMHGGGQTRYSWAGAAKQLAELGVDSLSVDARGHGESDWVASKNYSFFHYRDDLIALTEAVAKQFGQPPILIGASMGGLSGMLAVEKAGTDLFSAMVFVDITPTMKPSGVDRIQGFMAQNMKDGFAHVEEAADAIAAYLPHRPRPKSLDGLRKNLRQGEGGRLYWHWDPGFLEGPCTIDSGRQENGHLLLDACRAITVPTLLVRGGKSELVTQEAAKEFQQLVPHARYVDVTDAGHMVAGDKNDIFATAVIDFLREDVL